MNENGMTSGHAFRFPLKRVCLSAALGCLAVALAGCPTRGTQDGKTDGSQGGGPKTYPHKVYSFALMDPDEVKKREIKRPLWAQSLAFSPDGRWLAAAGTGGGSERLFRVVEAGTGQVWMEGQYPNLALGSPVSVGVIFTPDSKRLITWAGRLVVWDVAARKSLAKLEGGGGALRLNVTPDGKQLLFGSCNYDLATGKIDTYQTWPENETARKALSSAFLYGVGEVCLSPDGEWIAVRGSREVSTIDLKDGRETVLVKGGTVGVLHLSIAPKGDRVAAVVQPDYGPLETDRTAYIRVFARHGAADVLKFKVPAENVHALTYTPDARQLIGGCADKAVRFWDADKGTELRVLKDTPGTVRGLAVSSDGRWLAAGDDTGTVTVWRLAE